MYAILFYGNSPFTSNQGKIQSYIDKQKFYSFESIQKHILSKNDNIKVFFHTWDTNIDNIEYLKKFYKPEKYIESNSVVSYILSMNKVNLLKNEYEKENNMTFTMPI